MTPVEQPTMLYLPHLKELEVSGICALSNILKAAPNLDELIISFDCLKILMDDESTCDLLQQRIIHLDVGNWASSESDLFQRVMHTLCRVRYLCVRPTRSIILTESILSTILAQSNIDQLTRLTIVAIASEDVNKNLRQLVIDHTHLTIDDSFVVNYFGNCFVLWK